MILVGTKGAAHVAGCLLRSHSPGDDKLPLQSSVDNIEPPEGGGCSNTVKRPILDRGIMPPNTSNALEDAGSAAGSDCEQMYHVFRVQRRGLCARIALTSCPRCSCLLRVIPERPLLPQLALPCSVLACSTPAASPCGCPSFSPLQNPLRPSRHTASRS